MSRIGRLGKVSRARATVGDIIAAPKGRMMNSRRLIMCIGNFLLRPRRLGSQSSTDLNATARTSAVKFADALASSYRAQLGQGLIGAYLIGSLAHGGFSRRYSDIDVLLVTENGLDAAELTTLRGLAAECDATLSQKLSVFWSDRSFTVGRLPPLDRADYIDHAIVLTERERVLPVRPTLKEIPRLFE